MSRRKSYRSRNNLGQFTKGVSLLVTKELQELADISEIRVKALIRDELDLKLKANIRDSYAPTSPEGQRIKAHNENPNRKRKLAAHYHHTGTLIKSINTVIEGNTVVVKQKPLMYDNGTSAEQVYNWLTKGTPKTPKHDYYYFTNTKGERKLAKYYPTPKHLFEQHTIAQMDGFMTDLAGDLANNLNVKKKYKRYVRKRK